MIRVLQTVVAVINLLFLIFSIVLVSNDPFKRWVLRDPNLPSISDLSHAYPTELTPADIAFSIWGLIYLWNISVLLFSIVDAAGLMKRTSLYPRSSGTRGAPPLIPISYHILFFISTGAVVGWIVEWSKKKPGGAFWMLLATHLALAGAAAVLISRLKSFRTSSATPRGLCCLRGFVLGGTMIYATWTGCATLINFATYMIYGKPQWEIGKASTLSLSILFVYAVIWCVVSSTVVQWETQYIVSDWLTLIWASAFILAAHYPHHKKEPHYPRVWTTPNVLALLILMFAVIALVIRLVVSRKQGGVTTRVRENERRFVS